MFSREVGGVRAHRNSNEHFSWQCCFHCIDLEVSFCSFSEYLVTSSRMGHRLRKTAATVNSAPTLEV